NDAFLVKLSPEGKVLWARRGGGAAVDSARDLAMDASGNIYVTGRFGETATFGASTLTSVGRNDVFLVKYSPEGEVLWARSGGGAGEDWAYSVVVDAGGDAYLAGDF